MDVNSRFMRQRGIQSEVLSDELRRPADVFWTLALWALRSGVLLSRLRSNASLECSDQ